MNYSKVSLLLLILCFHVSLINLREDEVRNVSSVQFCPRDKMSWRLASRRKKCELKNRKSMYHCVLNPYLNETLEICGRQRDIVGFKCIEYNRGGKVIQESLLSCEHHKTPCPERYASTEAYKYQGCYEEVYKNRKMGHVTNPTTSEIVTDSPVTTNIDSEYRTVCKEINKKPVTPEKGNEECELKRKCLPFIISLIIVALSAMCFVIYFVVRTSTGKDKELKHSSGQSARAGQKGNVDSKSTNTSEEEIQLVADRDTSTPSAMIPEKLDVCLYNIKRDTDAIIRLLKGDACNLKDLRKRAKYLGENVQILRRETASADHFALCDTKDEKLRLEEETGERKTCKIDLE